MLIAAAAVLAACLMLTLPRIPRIREWVSRKARAEILERLRQVTQA